MLDADLDKAITDELNQKVNIMADYHEVKSYQHMEHKGGEHHQHGKPEHMPHPTRDVAMAPMGPEALGAGEGSPGSNDTDQDGM